MNILFLDKEGGYGGSSRSLHYMVKNLDHEKIVPSILLREEGPIIKEYGRIGINTVVCKCMPIYKPSKRKNIIILLLFLLKAPFFIRSYRYLCRTIADRKIGIVHMNHDSFFVYGLLLKIFKKQKIVFHIRTQFPDNIFARVQARIIVRIADYIVFISENEHQIFLRFTGGSLPHYSVIYNPAETLPELSCLPDPQLDCPPNTFKVLYLGNLDHNKGADRLLEVAQEIKARNITDVIFIVCGKDRKETIGQAASSLVEEAESAGVSDYFRFMGHQPIPELFLKNSDILIRLSRGNDPWGRDIIEAMVHGKPVLATGTFEGFVRPGITGYLLYPCSASLAADRIIELATNSKLRKDMREASLTIANDLFNARKHGQKMTSVFQSVNGCNTKK